MTTRAHFFEFQQDIHECKQNKRAFDIRVRCISLDEAIILLKYTAPGIPEETVMAVVEKLKWSPPSIPGTLGKRKSPSQEKEEDPAKHHSGKDGKRARKESSQDRGVLKPDSHRSHSSSSSSTKSDKHKESHSRSSSRSEVDRKRATSTTTKTEMEKTSESTQVQEIRTVTIEKEVGPTQEKSNLPPSNSQEKPDLRVRRVLKVSENGMAVVERPMGKATEPDPLREPELTEPTLNSQLEDLFKGIEDTEKCHSPQLPPISSFMDSEINQEVAKYTLDNQHIHQGYDPNNAGMEDSLLAESLPATPTTPATEVVIAQQETVIPLEVVVPTPVKEREVVVQEEVQETDPNPVALTAADTTAEVQQGSTSWTSLVPVSGGNDPRLEPYDRSLQGLLPSPEGQVSFIVPNGQSMVTLGADGKRYILFPVWHLALNNVILCVAPAHNCDEALILSQYPQIEAYLPRLPMDFPDTFSVHRQKVFPLGGTLLRGENVPGLENTLFLRNAETPM